MRASSGTLTVAQWELRAFLRRPSSYVLLLGAAGAAVWGFSWLVTLLSRGGGLTLRRADDPLAQFLGPNIFLIATCTGLVPLLTMGLVADERRRSNWEALLTAPVSIGQVLVGKFLAAWGVLLLALAPWPALLCLLRFWSGKTRWLGELIPWFQGGGIPVDPGPLVSGAIGLAMIAGTFVALGLLCSSVCRRPATAALLTFGLMGVSLIGALLPQLLEHWQIDPLWIRVAESASCWGHLEWFSRGTLLPRVLIGHLTLWVIALWLATHLSRRVDDA